MNKPLDFSLSIANQLPYVGVENGHMMVTNNLDLISTIKLGGVPYQTIDAVDINALKKHWVQIINNLMRKKKVALWTHLIRKKVKFSHSDTTYDNAFSKEFADEYYKKIGSEDQFYNELYVTPVYQAAGTKIDKIALNLSKKNQQEISNLYKDNVEELNKILDQLKVSLRRYHPELLTDYEEDGLLFSKQSEFFNEILNHSERKIVSAKEYASANLMQKEIDFGKEIFELQGNADSEYGAVLSLEIPYGQEQIDTRTLEGLLSAPFEFTLSQSVTTMPFKDADDMLNRKINNIKSTTDNQSQLKKLEERREALQSGDFNYLMHELIIVLYGNNIKELNKNVNNVTEIFERKGLGLSRLRRAVMKRSYYNMMPGNFLNKRQREVPVSEEAFAMMAPMHNHLTGNINGSQWGQPICAMKTTSETPYFFNYQVSRQSLKEQGLELDNADGDVKEHKKEVGNYKIIGRSGGGKTVIKMALRTLAKQNRTHTKPLKTFSFDVEFGEEIGIRALGGTYFTFTRGRPTGVNLFSLPDNSGSKAFIHQLLKWCVQKDSGFLMNATDDNKLLKAIHAVYRLPERQKRLSSIKDYLAVDGEGKDSLREQIGKWCVGGSMGWLLDNENDRFDLSTCNDFGFDMTEILNDDFARTPLLTYLTHKISLYAKGSPHIIDIAEAWKALKDPFMINYILMQGKMIRRQDGIMGLDTQDPDEIAKSEIGASLLSQFPTTIVLPNSTATEKDYIEGLGLTRREYDLIKETPEGTGQFLVKKGNESVMVKMDLSGMEDMLSILSSSSDNVALLHEIMNEVGEDPSVWLPIFKQRRSA